MVTIKDVAKKAGVSISTASLVINNKAGVSERLRAKVLAAIEELDYRPNGMARALKSKKSKVLGLIIPDIVNPFFPLVVRGVEAAALRYGYSLILGNTDGKLEEEARYLELFVEKCVDGIIFIPASNFKKNIRTFLRIESPKVVIDRALEGTGLPTVMTDNITGAYLATRHLLANGRRRILFISGPQDLQASQDRYKGYKKALGEFGLDEELVLNGDYTFDSGKRVMEQALKEKLCFDAVFGANDLMALGAMVVLSENKIKIPEDVEVVGYDNILFSSLSKPTLTTVEQPAYQMGYEATRLILRQIYSKKELSECKLLEPKLIVRESSPQQY
ncbi:MAG TPA: LacI family transcriptional regulator [Firmicutes bacterium]|uniref:LacI family DNA-binding transcriptional regulator n=1 Tax=Capillibacterium thermochitinicola TaxID=2699427 RepID=A0A8J6HQB4_9FIRM|nr:LacI family DNA-binding transcriptional regulator [Capillibacterium thermochitinicola]MBA2132096.1 LacI family DNA-binding transcriptional regulator [Capillibacterium thermochitinicola]HHW12843.1 LacI family transcriptional regulator [Bacillota bacterium]